MELIYAWIDDLYNIRNTEFQLNKEFDIDWNRNDFSLSVKYKGGVLPPDFFGNKITMVNAIVGANGSGKSTFLSFLFSWIGNLSVRHLLLFRHEVNGEQKILAYYNGAGEKEMLIEVQNAVNCTCEIRQENIGDDLVNHKFLFRIYLSNSIAIRPLHQTRNCRDLSTTCLLSTQVPIRIPAKEKSSKFLERSQFVAFTRAELSNQITFIQEKNSAIYLGFDEYIRTVGVHFASSLSLEFKNIPLTLNICKYSLELLNARAKSQNPKRTRIGNNFLVQCIFILHMLTLEGETAIVRYSEADKIFPKEPNNEGQVAQFFNAIMAAMLESSYINLYEYIIKQINLISCNASVSALHFPYNDLSFHLTFFQAEITLEATKSLLAIYDRNTEWGDFIEFHWNISAGENAMLNLFSRLYSIRNEVKEFANATGKIESLEEKYGRNVWLLIDEGELYFHPQWQKELVKYLTDFVPIIFPDVKVQIILAAHTPIVLSDIPGNNVIRFEKNGGGFTEINQEASIETFGANIFTLFEDSFFLKGGFIGTFATKKIMKVVSLLKEKRKLSSSEFEEAEKIISLIGDEILRENLREKLIDSDSENSLVTLN